MKGLGYYFVKGCVKFALHLYCGKIKVFGLDNIPQSRPVLFLPNHQNALIDVLLIAIDWSRKPYFLTRSDIFKRAFLKGVFNFAQMIPIYRIRDGRASLKNNQAVFDTCAELLVMNEAVVMFPEANHNLKRRVRRLSKGFTRIIFKALEKNPDLDIRIVPVGLNYKNAAAFPDEVAIYYGKDIAVQELYDPEDLKASILRIKEAVSERLKTLTTHIESEEFYEDIVGRLDTLGVNYLDPQAVNSIIRNLDVLENENKTTSKLAGILKLFKVIFMVLNFPIVLLWRTVVKPKVPEPEFMGTFRFAFALLTYPIYFGLLLILGILFWSFQVAAAIVWALFVFNYVYVRYVGPWNKD
ncbi:MAG: lysophospholipid acyltransferase family protein [Flavobacteriaceae bacterium]